MHLGEFVIERFFFRPEIFIGSESYFVYNKLGENWIYGTKEFQFIHASMQLFDI